MKARYFTEIMLSLLVVSGAILFSAPAAAADSEGRISLIGPDAVCVVDGDFEETFEPGDPVEVSRFNKQFAVGKVIAVKSSYMAVKLVQRDPEYFVEPGDRVHKPIEKTEKLKTLRAMIAKPAMEAGIGDTAEVTIDATAGGGAKSQSSDSMVVETHSTPAPSSTERLIEWQRGLEKESLKSAETEKKKAGKETGEEEESAEAGETKTESRRRKKARTRDE